MFKFNAGAMRPARDGARRWRFADANDLVRRTLARHGLMPDALNKQADVMHPPVRTPPAKHSGLQAHRSSQAKATRRFPSTAEIRQDQFDCDAGSRSFRTYVPSSAARGVTGVVVMLHGCTQTPEDFAAGTGMNGLAEEHGFVVIYPQQSRGNNAQSCWNWFSRGDQRRGRGEPAILAGLALKAAVEHGVARDRTFVAGLSAGAAMAVILGETYPDVFSAVGAHSGLPFGAASNVPSAFAAMAGRDRPLAVSPGNASPVRTIVFHGTTDSTVHPVNGERIAGDIIARSSEPTIESVEQGSGGGRSFERKITTTAEGRTKLEHWIVDGLGHAWSGGRAEGSYTDPRGPDASSEMIRFFFTTPDQDI